MFEREREFSDSDGIPIKLAVIKAVYISIALGLWLIALQLKQTWHSTRKYFQTKSRKFPLPLLAGAT